MYYIYNRATGNLHTKIIFGAEVLLTMFNKDIYEVVITNK